MAPRVHRRAVIVAIVDVVGVAATVVVAVVLVIVVAAAIFAAAGVAGVAGVAAVVLFVGVAVVIATVVAVVITTAITAVIGVVVIIISHVVKDLPARARVGLSRRSRAHNDWTVCSGTRSLRLAARLMPAAEAGDWLAEAISTLFEAPAGLRDSIKRDYLHNAPWVIVIGWARQVSRWTRVAVGTSPNSRDEDLYDDHAADR